MAAELRRSYVDSSVGQIHVVTCGPDSGPPVVLLHQTPRSWREWMFVMPQLAHRLRVIAIDLPGMGDSAPLPGTTSIEGWADVVAEVIGALDASPAHVVGHHTGGVVAVALAARHPGAVRSLVLSSTPFTDAEFRRTRAESPPIDAVEPSEDGTHLAALWQRRQAFYPPGRPDLLEAFVADALKVHDPEAGHRAVGAYRMEDAIGAVGHPALAVRATADPFAASHVEPMVAALVGASTTFIEGGTVPLPDHRPDEVAAVVLDWIERQEAER